ncbi:Tlg2-vesicle protein [Rhizina undulata]
MPPLSRHDRALYSPPAPHPPPPRWTRSRSRSLSSSRSTKRTAYSIAKTRVKRFHRWARKRVNKMSLLQKVLGVLFLVVTVTLTLLTLIFHTTILHALLPWAEVLRSHPLGFLPILALNLISAFPPMIGYSTSVTLSGFVYGFPNGWYVIAFGTILGSTLSFISCRYIFRSFAERMVSTDTRFKALSQTLKHDGLSLLCMIRLCPLPYSIGNGAISTFPTVSPWKFMIATAVATPKLLIHIFIGDRLAMLAQEDAKMDAKTKALNYGSIIGGILLGIVTGVLIYKRTMARAKHLEAEERSTIRDGGFTDDDPEAQTAAALITGMMEGEEDEDEEEEEEEDLLTEVEEDEEADRDEEYNLEDDLVVERNANGERTVTGEVKDSGVERVESDELKLTGSESLMK